MAKRARKVWAIDCETDPFLHGRVPEPFIWCAFDGSEYIIIEDTETFADWAADQHAYLYAHNGGKFDFMFLLPYIKKTRVKIIQSRVVEMEIGNSKLRDSFSIMPIALADYQKSEIEYWKMEREHRKEHEREITEYLKDDCKNLFDLLTEYRKHAGKGLTVAGNALNYARKECEIEVGRTNAKFDGIFRAFYYGGRCECFLPGVHKNVAIFDIKSAYPFAMVHDHAHTSDYTIRDRPNMLAVERLQQCFLIISCFSHGAFPVRSGVGINFPIGPGTFYVTGWEYVAALKHKLIGQVEIHKCYEFYDTINFSPYVNHWFEHKDNAAKRGDKANKLVAKFMLNSLYGKMAQNPVHYKDYQIVDAGTPPEDGWNLEAEINGSEIHSRSTLWKLKEKFGDDWKTFPVYYNVATGASITGFCRALLLDAIHTVGISKVAYCDTDCVFVRDTPSNPGDAIRGLRQDGALGAWEWEGTAEVCYLAGKKLYGAKVTSGPKKGEKIASKGVKLKMADMVKLCAGEKIRYENPAPTFKIDGSADFVVRNIIATHKKE